MRIKHVTPSVYYLALVSFSDKLWKSGNEDNAIGHLEGYMDESNGWEYENYNGPAADASADFGYAFDKIAQRRKFIKALKKHLNEEIKLVTVMDVTAD